MKKCDYYREQIILKFYDEKFDAELSLHLSECDKCRTFESELNQKLNIKIVSVDFNRIKSDIVETKRVLKRLRFGLWIFAAAAGIVLTFSLVYFYYISQPPNQNMWIAQNKTSKIIDEGVDDIDFSILESDFDMLEEKLDLLLEEDENEEI
ncbi:MAG: hypothetical protein AB1765_10205 [Candidatus Hydrogenedentota bacterium]